MTSSSHGPGGRPERGPLRRTTRAEATRARRERRGWRNRKLTLIFAAMPIVAIGLAGYAMAAPGYRHHHGPPPVCATAGSTSGPTAGSTSGPTAGSTSGSTSASSSSSSSASPSAPAGGLPTSNAPTYNGMPMSTASTAAGTQNDASMSYGDPTTQPASGDWRRQPTSWPSPTHRGWPGKPTTPASATAPASAPATATASPSPTGAATCVTPSATATAPMTGSMSASASATATAPAATPNPNCTLIVPANPLTAQGLATPYQFTATDAAMGPCNESNINQSAFVQATVYNPATGALSVYDPLVVDQGTTPAAPPVVPTLPYGAVVGIWFGFNATNLDLQDSGGSLAAGKCVNGLGTSLFSQFAYCNAPAFFAAVNQGIGNGLVKVPGPGTAVDGRPCLTTRDFALIDQDQSDNVTTDYLATAAGRTAQDNAANAAALGGAVTLANPSDNALLDVFLDPALHCTPWTEPNLGNGGAPATSLGLDEIQANAFPPNPVALIPLNDPMTLVNGAFSQAKTNLYRMGVDQPALPTGTTPQAYCSDMDGIQSTRLQQDVNLLINRATPDAGAADSLFAFVAMRLQQSFENLNCQNFGLTNPVSSIATDADGVVVGAVFAHQVKAITPGPGNPAEACVTMTDPDAQMACALAAVGGNTQSAAPTPTMMTASPKPSGDMRRHSGHHW